MFRLLLEAFFQRTPQTFQQFIEIFPVVRVGGETAVFAVEDVLLFLNPISTKIVLLKRWERGRWGGGWGEKGG